MSNVGQAEENKYVEPPPAQLRDHVCIFGDAYLPEGDLAIELRNVVGQQVLAYDAVTEEPVSLVAVSAEMHDSPKHIRCVFSYEQKQQRRPARFPVAADIRYDFTAYDTRATLVLDSGRVLIVRATHVMTAALSAAPQSSRLVTPPRPDRPVRRRQTITPVKREPVAEEEEDGEEEEDQGDTAPLSGVTQRLSNVSVGTQVLQEEYDATQQLVTPPRSSMGPPPPRSAVRASPARVNDDFRLPTPPRPAAVVPWPPGASNPTGRRKWIPFAPPLDSLEGYSPPREEEEEEKKNKSSRRRKNKRFYG